MKRTLRPADIRRHNTSMTAPTSARTGDLPSASGLQSSHEHLTSKVSRKNTRSAKPAVVQISTSEYKISPLKKAARELLGYPHPRRVPRGLYIEQAIGISTDEFTRAKDSGVRYLRNVFPLIDLGWDRAQCVDYLAERGFGETVKSACVGCPFHGNAGWRWIRDNDPDGWAEAIEFDKAIRDGYPRATKQGQELRGQYFLHRSCQPLDRVDLDASVSRKRHLQLVSTKAAEKDDPNGCSPWSCRSGEPLTAPPRSVRHDPGDDTCRNDGERGRADAQDPPHGHVGPAACRHNSVDLVVLSPAYYGLHSGLWASN